MSNLENCKRIYTEAFGMSEPFDSELFGAFSQNIKALEIGSQTVAMLFLLPCKLVANGKEIKAGYIYAAATDKRYRGMGYMSRLMSKVCASDDVFYFLKPATSELEGFYRRLGFKCAEGVENGEADAFIEVCETQKSLQKKRCDCPEKYILMYKKADEKIEKLSFKYPME